MRITSIGTDKLITPWLGQIRAQRAGMLYEVPLRMPRVERLAEQSSRKVRAGSCDVEPSMSVERFSSYPLPSVFF
jgi:hypothetical protein